MKHASLQIIRDEHSSLTSILRSMLMMVERGPTDGPDRFFDVLRTMLFYIDEFPERLHHRKESDLLFPRVARAAPAVMPTVEKLERDHMNGEKSVREPQHALVAWELMGEPRRPAYTEQLANVRFWSEADILPNVWLEAKASAEL